MKNLVISALIVTTLTACPSNPYIGPVEHVIVDCTKLNQADILAVVVTFATDILSGGGFDWSAIKAQAIAAGRDIGGCAIAAFTNRLLAPAPGIKAPAYDQSIAARTSLEDVRVHFGGSVSWLNGEGQGQ